MRTCASRPGTSETSAKKFAVNAAAQSTAGCITARQSQQSRGSKHAVISVITKDVSKNVSKNVSNDGAWRSMKNFRHISALGESRENCFGALCSEATQSESWRKSYERDTWKIFGSRCFVTDLHFAVKAASTDVTCQGFAAKHTFPLQNL